MTKREAAIISLYTGVMVGNFADMHKYAEELMDTPIFTHQFGGAEYVKTMKEKCRPDFMKLCDNLKD
jgi:hypothetical protein